MKITLMENIQTEKTPNYIKRKQIKSNYRAVSVRFLWSLCLVVFHALTLKLPIQTSLSVAPKLQACVRSHEKRPNLSETSTP